MPSLRQRMTTYLRQLSFINEPRDDSPRIIPHHHSINPTQMPGGDGCFVSRYLDGRMTTKPLQQDTQIYHGKEPAELPDMKLQLVHGSATTITAACTGPDDGLSSIRRSRLHLSAGPEIDFIDTADDQEPDEALDVRRSAPKAIAKYRRNVATTSDPNANSIRATAGARFGPVVQPTVIKGASGPNKPKNVTINLVVRTIRAADNAAISKESDARNNKVASNKSQPATNNNEKQCKPLGVGELQGKHSTNVNDHSIAGSINWKLENEDAYGLSVSLYEKNAVSNERIGDPIADCYGLLVRGESAVLAMADGVNWGEGARLAARSAVQGCLEYLDTAIFGLGAGGMAETTREVFVSLLRSFSEAHDSILEVGGALSTLTAAVVLPLGAPHVDRHIVCSCNVGDSFGYVYSKKHGVREFTQGSHDILNMRDMRDALGALGPVSGNKPELSNLTLSMTIVESGDIVFLTSDGISDNFDPVVGKFAEPFTERSSEAPVEVSPVQQLAPKRQNRSTSAIISSSTAMRSNSSATPTMTSSRPPVNPMKQPQLNETQRRNRPPMSAREPPKPSTPKAMSADRPKFLRSHTVIEPRTIKNDMRKITNKLPMVTGQQRHTLTLLRLEDLLCYGINGTQRPCPSARKLCHLLVDFAQMITSARRSLLEQRELFYRMVTDPVTGIRSEVELNKLQQRSARKRVVDGNTFSQLPGKLDHASVVAFTVESSVRPILLQQLSHQESTKLSETNF